MALGDLKSSKEDLKRTPWEKMTQISKPSGYSISTRVTPLGPLRFPSALPRLPARLSTAYARGDLTRAPMCAGVCDL